MEFYTWITLLFAIISVAKCRKKIDYEGGDISITGEGGLFFSPKESAEGRRLSDKRQRQNEIPIRKSERKEEEFKLKMFPEAGVIQIKLQVDLVMDNPEEGRCMSDKFEVRDSNGNSKIELCGQINNETVYLDRDSESEYVEIIVKKVDEVSVEQRHDAHEETPIVPKWQINGINYITAESEDGKLGCLQYFTEPTGTLQSFNFGGQEGDETPHMALINQRYKICFKELEGYCDIEIIFERFDLGTIQKDPWRGGLLKKDIPCEDDYLLINGEKYCDDAADKTIYVDGFEPISVFMDDNQYYEVEGFKGRYTMRENCVRAPSGPTGTTESNATNPKPPVTTVQDTTTSDPSANTSDALNFFWL